MGLKTGLFLAVILGAAAVASAGLLLPETKLAPKRTCDAPIAQTKPGRCPKQLLAIQCIWCNDLCKSDDDCPGNSKCCPQPSCGNMCANPVYEEKVPEKVALPKKLIPLPVPDKVIPLPKKVIALPVPDKVIPLPKKNLPLPVPPKVIPVPDKLPGKLVPGTIIPGTIIPVPVRPEVLPIPIPNSDKTIQIPGKLIPGTVLPIPGTLIPISGKFAQNLAIPDKIAPLTVILGK